MIEELLIKTLKDLGVSETPRTEVNSYGICIASLPGTYEQLDPDNLQKKLNDYNVHLKTSNGNTQIVTWRPYEGKRLPGDPEELIRVRPTS